MALADSLVALIGNLNVSGMLARVPHPYTRADADDFLTRMTLPDAMESVFALHRKPDDTFIGISSFTHGDKPELGYWLGEPFWRQGYMSEAAEAVVTHAFNTAKLAVLYSGCRIENTASRAVLEKLGFERTGERSRYSVSLGRDVPSYRFILRRERWESLQ